MILTITLLLTLILTFIFSSNSASFSFPSLSFVFLHFFPLISIYSFTPFLYPSLPITRNYPFPNLDSTSFSFITPFIRIFHLPPSHLTLSRNPCASNHFAQAQNLIQDHCVKEDSLPSPLPWLPLVVARDRTTDMQTHRTAILQLSQRVHKTAAGRNVHFCSMCLSNEEVM